MPDPWTSLSRPLCACLLLAGVGAAPLPPVQTEPYVRASEDPGKLIALEMAARSFAPEQGAGPTVALVGVAHIGERKLYDAVQTLLDEHDVVLYESIKPAGTGGAGGRNEQQRIQSTRAAMGFVATVLEAHHRGRQKYPDDLEELVEFAAGSAMPVSTTSSR